MPAVSLSGASVPVSIGGDPIGEFHPGMRGVENLGAGAQAMENFAEEPFAAVNAAAFGEILRADFARERGDFRGLGHAGVVLPQPGHARRDFWRTCVLNASGLPLCIHGQRRAAGGVHAEADDLVRLEAAHGFFGGGERFLDGDLRAGDVIGRMLAGEVGVARKG